MLEGAWHQSEKKIGGALIEEAGTPIRDIINRRHKRSSLTRFELNTMTPHSELLGKQSQYYCIDNSRKASNNLETSFEREMLSGGFYSRSHNSGKNT